MFRQILLTHWRWTRTIVVSMAVVNFLTPAAAWWLGATRVLQPMSPMALMLGMRSVPMALVLTAILGAFLLAAYPWSIDAQARHTLALSLPISWRRYVAMRFGAGALSLLLPAVTLWLGALLALAMIDLPATLRAYPGTLALRFLSASLVAYAATFALQYLAGRRSAVVALVTLVTLVVALSALEFTGNRALIDRVTEWLTTSPGPLAVFAAEWKLIDV